MAEGGEQEPQPRGKFGSRKDEALYVLSLDGWSNESSGDVQAPSGWFARISITPEELPEVVEAFSAELAEVGVTDTSILLGHHLLVEDDRGFVGSEPYATQEAVEAAYAALSRVYDEWLGDES